MTDGLCLCGCGKKTRVADVNSSRNGWVKGSPMGFLPSHSPRKSLSERLWEKVRKGPDCWEWIGGRNHKAGYGKINDGTGMRYAHRVSWTIHNGKIPDGLWVLHRCDNPKCVRPDHLFLGTRADNIRDASEKGRLSVPKPGMRGELHHAAKLTPSDVAEIRASDGLSGAVLSRKFGVSQTHIGRIRRMKTWI